MKCSIITTQDGSSSISIENWGETYHSIFGAVQEAVHVYIKNGLLLINKPSLNILEMGFGTGLNFCLTYKEALLRNLEIQYTAVEGFPLTENEFLSLNYFSYFPDFSFEEIHRLTWDETHQLTKNISLHKNYSLFENLSLPHDHYDLIYFDVFGYNYQPELWSETILQNMFHCLKSDGILVTYASKGVVNRTLKSIGFTVKKMPGPPGKREMTIAIKP